MDAFGRGGLRQLLERRLSRRSVISHGSLLTASLLPGLGQAQHTAATESSTGDSRRPAPLRRIAASREDRVRVPDGYRADVVLRWGDPVVAGAGQLDVADARNGSLMAPGAAGTQARCFGINCDGIGVFSLDDDRLVLAINHEYPIPALMFPGWNAARQTRTRGELMRRNPEAVRTMQAALGVSVVELERNADRVWRPVSSSRRNRRVTATTPMVFSGPASHHRWLGGSESRPGECLGTLGNCAAGTTPWGTYLTAEENTDDFFGNAGAADLDPDLARAHRRFGLYMRDSLFRWEYVDPRFDTAHSPAEAMKFGWVVEIDPMNPAAPIRKRTALGRMKHEAATTVLSRDGRPVVYMGDDEVFEYFYKFVGDGVFDPDSPERNRDLLDRGTLCVARLDDDGSGQWLPLIWGEHPDLTEENGFRDQGDVLVRCREAADLVGATALDRPEDVAVHPETGRIYLSCTQNLERGVEPEGARDREIDAWTDRASPRPENRWGHILEFAESGDDFAAERFQWDVFVLAGDPKADELLLALPVTGENAVESTATYFAGQADADRLSAFANPDNLGFDSAGNLWIVTDGAQPGGNNNGCFVCPTTGPDRGAVRQFMSGPVGAEICGCEFTPDGSTLFLTVQHPGSGGSVENPISHWPDGGEAPPRSSLVAISPLDDSGPFGT